MANRFIVRNGDSAPSSDNLLQYELGYDSTNKKLYIGEGNNKIKVKWLNIFILFIIYKTTYKIERILI